MTAIARVGRNCSTAQLLELPVGSRVRDWDKAYVQKTLPDVWAYEMDDGTIPDHPFVVTSDMLAMAFGPAVLVELPPEYSTAASLQDLAAALATPDPVARMVAVRDPSITASHEGALRDKARRAAHEERGRRFTLGYDTTGQAYTDSLADAVVTALLPDLGIPGAPVPAVPAPVPAVQHVSVLAQVSPEARVQMEDVLLEYRGTPRRRLFEYPHRDDDSRRMIAAASAAVTQVLGILQRGLSK